MSNLVKDLSSIELETLDNIRSSKSVNTIRAYKSDFNHFVNFCKKNNFKPLPADPKFVSFYITDLSSNSKVSTLKRRLASISVIHKLKGHYIDIKHPLIIENENKYLKEYFDMYDNQDIDNQYLDDDGVEKLKQEYSDLDILIKSLRILK